MPDALAADIFKTADAARTALAARYERESMEIVRIGVDRRWWAEGFNSE